MKLKDTFKKQGGIALLKQYWQGGAFFTAVGELLLLGKSRTALEILRLSAQLKVKQKLKMKYESSLEAFDKSYDMSLPHKKNSTIWICWFQGMEQAPFLVQKCFRSVKDNLADHDVILITSENMGEYVQFPDFIMEKWEKGQITHTHMTDLLRLELLIRYGGMWLDATVLCTEKQENIPDYYFDSDLFLYQFLKPGRDGHAHLTSSWLISAKTNNKILMAVRALCYEYWKEHSDLIDYFLLHDFMAIVLEFYPQDWLNIVPQDNAAPHILYLRLFEPYNDKVWENIKAGTPFHKLSYKFEAGKDKLKGTYYDVLLKREDYP